MVLGRTFLLGKEGRGKKKGGGGKGELEIGGDGMVCRCEMGEMKSDEIYGAWSGW